MRICGTTCLSHRAAEPGFADRLDHCDMLAALLMLVSVTTIALAHQPLCAHAGEMVFEFTQIRATQPEKPYSFAVKVEGESFTGETHQQRQGPEM